MINQEETVAFDDFKSAVRIREQYARDMAAAQQTLETAKMLWSLADKAADKAREALISLVERE